MALFGAPTAHEDDPERAVRAALAMRDWAREEGDDLQVRIAVTTGEALVSLGARPSEGEGMAAGDVVNTAARLQAAAPANGILVGQTTYQATKSVVEYRPHEPVEAKGKSDPIPVWEAVEARSRVQVDRLGGAALVGREAELALLRDALDRVRREREPQLVTLVGVPGIGKSRLVYELFKAIEESPDILFWRRGRSLPYGEGVTFWALAEVVKAQAGILESDPIDEVEQKLRRSVADLMEDEADQRWVRQYLRPLVGLAREEELGGERREEAFAAWRRFLESLADHRPLVLVLEDLHWADDALLDFVDELVEWASGVSLFVLCTARPEFLARRPGWGGGKPNAVTLSLAPLSERETAELVHELLGRAVLPAETQSALLARAEGNPLYAEEFVRLTREGGLGRDGDAGLPESVHGIIAARLDGLDPSEKRLLQDAAVLGKVFWAGALAEIAGLDRREVEQRLHALERKEFVRRARRASVEGETEYDFRHILVRDVAYGQIPRAQRAEKHSLTADWIESLGRLDDHAEMLAHHFLTSFELNRAVGKDDPTLGERARPALRAAGDRAMALAAYEPAARFYASALQLCPSDDPDRPGLLLREGRANFYADGSGLELFAEARLLFRASGDDEGAAEAATAAANLLWWRGERDEAYEYASEAVELLSKRPASPAKASALLTRSAFHLVTAEFPECLRLAGEALPIAEQLGLDGPRARALNVIGWGRIGTGDPEGLGDLEQAVETALAAGAVEHFHSSFENLRSAQFALGRLAEARATLERHVQYAERLAAAYRLWLKELRAGEAFRTGDWEDALRLADSFLDEVERSPHYLEPPCRALRAAVRLTRG